MGDDELDEVLKDLHSKKTFQWLFVLIHAFFLYIIKKYFVDR